MNNDNENHRKVSELEKAKSREKIEALRQMSPDERLKAALELSELSLKLCSQKD